MEITFPCLGKITMMPIVQFMKVIFKNIIELEDFYNFKALFALGFEST